jgi:hypothetical protein
MIEQSLRDAQSDLEAYLGRPVTRQTYTQKHLLRYHDGYHLTHFPVHEVVSETEEIHYSGEPTGYYTVVYEAGLDGESDPELEPIRRFVRTHAMYSDLVQALYRRLAPESARKVVSLNVEGQSVTYGDTFASDPQASAQGLPGGLPSMKSCDRWRIAGRMPHMAPTRVSDAWPFEDFHYRYGGNWWA